MTCGEPTYQRKLDELFTCVFSDAQGNRCSARDCTSSSVSRVPPMFINASSGRGKFGCGVDVARNRLLRVRRDSE